ncbi:23S rRNA (uracil(1939)-C(5))-methyltransferase RlmD [Jeotgalibaca sp. MA1X17-3]|uniref:23S rRNA (uracil(1939)-C(5))-methyltransferase RlmD n=1 Tax=Jeotgalibaca sp. MA1X17-3 TaxID=2908211 RepID=UPI001F1CEABA|nr:23S rRNA (uracil(1939)-C(5))-methyltransferase RlmD [Jeotgalibaca sp. MA1X17-3]UJF16261.1 23S rRNA (uracil(1939)-C(5))-methyltransferase RlmD [Jeotgalibaca sp. MA1X17-3]
MKKEIYPTEVLDVTIEHLDSRGYGYVGHIHPPTRGSNGKTLNIFVKNVVPGDEVRVTIENAKGRRKAVVDYDKLLKPGPTRNLEVPTHTSVSGGVPLQYMHYTDQLAYKMDLVKGYLKEAGFDDSLVKPIIGMNKPTRYRNKMELTFGPNGELGMTKQGDFRKVIDLEDSILAPEIMVDMKHVISQWQKDYQIPGYDKTTQSGILRNLLLRTSFATGELMVVVYAKKTPEVFPEAVHDLVQRLTSQFEQLVSLQWVEHAAAVERIQTDATHILHGRDYIHDELNGFKYRIWPDTFFQANPVQAEKLVDLALQMADVNADMRVLDLFCGVGTFSLPFAKRSKELAGIELVEKSILSARRNATDNHLYNTYFMASDARIGLRKLKETWGQPDLLILDPPRSGAGGKVMRSIGRLGTNKIIYISCSPKSLAEDLRWLNDFGYELVTVQPVDQFPHTAHVETVVLLSRVEK